MFRMIGFAGSRSLPSVGRQGGLVSRVVGSVASAHRVVAVGCCVGADAAVLRARLALALPSSTSGTQVVVFAAFGPDGAGSCPVSAVKPVCSLAAPLARSPGHGCWAPVSVHWWAGGGAAVPLHQRLAARSSALVSALAGSPGSALVAFVGPGRSVGTWRTVKAAFAAGVPVFVFPVGCSVLSFPRVPGARFWLGVGGSGIWSHAFMLR